MKTMQRWAWGGLFALVLMMSPWAASAQLDKLFAFIEYGDSDLGLINTETDQLIQVHLPTIEAWPGSTPQHVWVSADGQTIYVSVDATEVHPASVVVLNVEGIDWAVGMANLTIATVLILDPPGTPADFPLVEEVDPRQPVRGWGCFSKPTGITKQTDDGQPIVFWMQSPYTRAHGPTFLPGSPFMYLTHLTDNRIRVIDSRTNAFAEVDPLSLKWSKSRQTHGVNCNVDATYCLGTGYFFDQTEIDVYIPDPVTGALSFDRSITLCDGQGCAAITHYTVWLDNSLALTATMQFGPTSLTPPGQEIIGPSAWLLDMDDPSPQATLLIGPAAGPDDPGIFRSASDVQVAGTAPVKLYVAEEDTLDRSFADDGYVSVFDISDPRQPRFLKRLRPGVELPEDYCVSHSMTVTPDGRFLYVTSYACHYIVKIDTATDEVLKVYGAADGLDGPHGSFIAGTLR